MSLKQLLLALCAGVVLIQAGLKCAKAEPPYEIVLEDEFGNVLPAYAQRGELFALGREGQRYNVRIRNHTGRRIEAVVSVDGRDVLSGEQGDYKRQRGYLVPAYGSVIIEGFRQSLEQVAAFRFTAPGDSYSSRMGTPENVGVIGAAIFPEAPRAELAYPRAYRAPSYPETRSEPRARDKGYGGLGSAGPRPAAPAEPERSARGKAAASGAPTAERYAESARDDSSNIGTEYGETTRSEVSEVSFRRARQASPERVLTMRYDDYAGLVARGILPRPAPRPVRGPSAFPVNRFAAPPPPRPYWD